MTTQAMRLIETLPPVAAGRSPWKAYLIGFFFSGAGLGVYFRSWFDLVAPTVLWLVLMALPGEGGFWLGAFLGGTWGLVRAYTATPERS
jgi:hypothetical protein